MASIPNGFPISLRSWPSKSADATDLPTLFQRIQTERGGFLNISEESLREEIAKEESGQVLEDESEDEEDKGAEDIKARAAARQELLQQITTAHHSALNSLNFVSLLLSKTNPAAVSKSISPELRDLIPLGTLGATRAATPWITAERREDNKVVAKGWKSRDVDKSIDSILASATRLENEIQKETVYWEEILSLHDKGWSVSKLPRRKGVMGVRLGSSEATPVLRAQGLAVLSRNETGSLQLNSNPNTVEAKILRVRIEVNDEITGTSSIPIAIPTSASTSSRLLETRNTLFALELWHELNRESRTLGAFNIQSRGDTLLFPLTATKTAILDLHILPESHDPTPSPLPDDIQAQGLYIALNLLLSYSHRQSLRRRSMPPKPKPNPKRQNTSGPVQNKQPLFADSPTLLRPLLTLFNHQTSLTQLHTLFTLLTQTLSKTKLNPQPTYTITPIPPNPPMFLASAERSIATLTNHLSAHLTFSILRDTDLKVMLRTSQTSLPTTIFHIQFQPETAQLSTICPSPGTLLSFEQVEEYVLFVTSSAMALRFSSISSSEEDRREDWQPTHYPPTLKYTSKNAASVADGKLLTFSVLKITSSTSSKEKKKKKKPGLKLRCTYTYSSDTSISAVGNQGENLLDDSKIAQLVRERLGSARTLSFDGIEEKQKREVKKERKGEGFYEWVVWDGEDSKGGDVIGDRDGDDEEVREGEVMKRIGDVINIAEK